MSRFLKVDYSFLPEQKATYYEAITDQQLYLSKSELISAFSRINEMFYKDFFIGFNVVLEMLGGHPVQDYKDFGWSFENESQDYSWSYFSPPWIRPQYYVNKGTGNLMICFEVEPEPIDELYS